MENSLIFFYYENDKRKPRISALLFYFLHDSKNVSWSLFLYIESFHITYLYAHSLHSLYLIENGKWLSVCTERFPCNTLCFHTTGNCYRRLSSCTTKLLMQFLLSLWLSVGKKRIINPLLLLNIISLLNDGDFNCLKDKNRKDIKSNLHNGLFSSTTTIYETCFRRKQSERVVFRIQIMSKGFFKEKFHVFCVLRVLFLFLFVLEGKLQDNYKFLMSKKFPFRFEDFFAE